MSLEQASGGLVDGRSDLFSLGILFVEILTGARVFDGGHDAVTIRKISECERAGVQAATSMLPRELREICERALAKSPADRFQDGAEYARALRGYMLERGLLYLPGDCAAETHALGAIAARSGEGISQGVALSKVAGTSVRAEQDTSPSKIAEQASEPRDGGCGEGRAPARAQGEHDRLQFEGERVAASCDSIKTRDWLLSFSGLAVGDRQHVGLRVLDSGVPTGTSSVVYVNASAAVR